VCREKPKKQNKDMSKFVLQKQAYDASGVSFSESERVLKLSPTIFERLGEDGIELLSTLFYDRVFHDKDSPWFLSIFASSSKSEAIENQYLFFVQTFGGPDLYRYVNWVS
jgi:Bacterial-like globin